MIVAYACIRTSIMYKCSKFVFCAWNAQNVKSQQSATKLQRLCFYTCLSFCSQGGGSASVHVGMPPWPCFPRDQALCPWDQAHPSRTRHPPGTRHTPPGPGTPPGTRHPPRRLLLRTVRILLECILVFTMSCVRVYDDKDLGDATLF